MENFFERNIENIQKRMKAGLSLLRQHYTLRERSIPDYFRDIRIRSNHYHVTQYDIVGVGNLLVMTSTENPDLQMDSFVLTPYCKELPLFTSDYMYMGQRRGLLNEVYDLVDPEQKNETYQGFIDQFAANCRKYAHIQQMPVKPCWYDSIRSVCIGLSPAHEQDNTVIQLFLDNLQTFIEMEQAMPPITDPEQLHAKWQIVRSYSDRLVDEGGVSTDVFKAVLGTERTKAFFNDVFFAPGVYAPR